MPGALDHLLVLDLTSHLSGPYCAMLLADHGAEVIKIEPPQGDAIRNLMPFPDLAGIKVLHGKESVVLDLDDDAD
ncbi:MAG: CoA transferase, partial [Rhodopila sp.]